MNLHLREIGDITDKWELAQRISGHAKAPKEVLESLFQGAMDKLEEVSQTKFDSTMKGRVWDSVSKERLVTLKETFLLAFCEKILGGFNDKEVKEMLEEHKKIGSVRNLIYSVHLQTALAFNKEDIIETVIQKANSMTKKFVPEIIDAIKKEGIQFPEKNDL